MSIPASDSALEEKDTQLNVYNFRDVIKEPPAHFSAIRFDPNNTCNLHCVYCHNWRSEETLSAQDLMDFIDARVLAVKHFQIGCVMEPTLDKRLADLMLAVSTSRAKPSHAFMLQTNGILLHKHDFGKMREAGLTVLSVSVDAADPETQKELRNGTSLDRVVRNVRAFREALPDVKVSFITTVTTSNIAKVNGIVALGLDLGVKQFVFREVFYHPENTIVDHARMPGLLLKPGQFQRMKDGVLGLFEGQAEFIFADSVSISTYLEKIKTDSLLTKH
jgi:MoaA/NifB/PqqE/SkfB family radical SAM enzyme